METARKIWREMYQGEPFDMDIKADWSQRSLPVYTTRMSHDVISAVAKQQDFYYQVRNKSAWMPFVLDKISYSETDWTRRNRAASQACREQSFRCNCFGYDMSCPNR